MEQAVLAEDRNGLSERGWSNVRGIMPKIKAAVEVRESEADFIDLSSAENWLLRPELTEICKNAISDGLVALYFSYPKAFAGYPNVLAALAAFFNSYFQPYTPVQVSHLACAPGAAACLDTLFYNTCDPGDAILLAGPYWKGFDFQLKARSSVTGISVVVDDLEGCLTDALIPALEAAFERSDRPVKALLLTNPHNPFSRCYSRACIEECIKFCHRRNIHYISDEVYALSSFSSPNQEGLPAFVSALSIDVKGLGCDPSRVHVVWSPSKDLGQSGMRMGCSITQTNQEMNVGLALASNTTTSSLSAIFLTELLTSSELPKLIELNSTRLGKAYASVTTLLRRHNIPYIPANAGIFVFAKIAPKAETWEDEAAAVQQLKEAGVVVSGGQGFHGPEGEKGWARILFSVEESALTEALRRMDDVLSKEPAIPKSDS